MPEELKYKRVNWKNAPSKDTPITAENLNHMDEAIESLYNEGAISKAPLVQNLDGNEIDKVPSVQAVNNAIKGKFINPGTNLDNSIYTLNPLVVSSVHTARAAKSGSVVHISIMGDFVSSLSTATNKTYELLTFKEGYRPENIHCYLNAVSVGSNKWNKKESQFTMVEKEYILKFKKETAGASFLIDIVYVAIG